MIKCRMKRRPIHKSIICLILFTIITTVQCFGNDDTDVVHFNIADLCDPSKPNAGQKHEIRLGKRSAKVTLNSYDLKENLACHLEFESESKQFGFHVFIMEMHMDGDEETEMCEDYVQMARDIWVFTVAKSIKYCHRRDAVNFTTSRSGHLTSKPTLNTDHSRWFVSESDYEMDMWFKMRAPRRRRVIGRGQDDPLEPSRNVTILVTVFKRDCPDSDREYVRCKYTNACISRKLICDGLPSCGWPSGELATDEVLEDCDRKRFMLRGSNSNGRLRNKPSSGRSVTIAIIGLAIFTVFAVCFIFLFKRTSLFVCISDESRESRSDRRRRRRPSPRRRSSRLSPREGGGGEELNGDESGDPPMGDADSALVGVASAPPPTYEEAMKMQPLISDEENSNTSRRE